MNPLQDPIERAWKDGSAYTIAEFKQELRLELEPDPSRDSDPDVYKCLLALGEAGVGKTQAIRQVLEEIRAEYCMYHHGATMEEDNAGTPYQSTENGKTITKIAIPDHLACFWRPPNGRVGALVMEEIFTGATSGHQNQVRQFVDRRFGLQTMLPGWRVIGTSNPSTAEFNTVHSIDLALAKRMIIFPVKPSDTEKLAYWQGRMHPVLHLFLSTWKVQGRSIIQLTDSRTWMNLSDSLFRRQGTSGWVVSETSLLKLFTNHVGKEVAPMFVEFASKSVNEGDIPIDGARLLSADIKEASILLTRIEKWGKAKKVALLGTTKWSLCVCLADRIKENKEVTDREQDILAEFINLLCTVGHAHMAEEIISLFRQSPLSRTLIEKLKGKTAFTKLEKLLSGTLSS